MAVYRSFDFRRARRRLRNWLPAPHFERSCARVHLGSCDISPAWMQHFPSKIATTSRCTQFLEYAASIINRISISFPNRVVARKECNPK
jgi:hypothetical protein